MTIRKIFGVMPTTEEQVKAYIKYAEAQNRLAEVEKNGAKCGYTLNGVTQTFAVGEEYNACAKALKEKRNALCVVLTGMTEEKYEIAKALERAKREAEYWNNEIARLEKEYNA